MNETGACVICQRTTERMACEHCQNQMRLQLTNIVDYQALASGNLLPGQGGDGRSTERSLGINVAALDLVGAFDAIAVLESWERIWREDYGLSPYGPASALRDPTARGTLLGIVSFLQSWLTKSCTEHPAIDEFAHELRTLHRSCQQAAGQTQRAAWRVTCPADVEDGECGNQLRVSGQDFGGQVTCRACNTTWPVDRLLHVVATSRHAELWLDPEAASEWLGVHTGTLRKWAKDGRIKRERGRYEVHSLKAAMV
jgi:hypothetical protein